MTPKVQKTEEEWQRELPKERYEVLRGKGTERPWSGELVDNKQSGMYRCAACGEELFRSDAKFESGTGWPSFHSPAADDHVATETDSSHGMVRNEVLCASCESHLGHVFDDGPQPTGQRYCINSLALEFEPEEDAS